MGRTKPDLAGDVCLFYVLFVVVYSVVFSVVRVGKRSRAAVQLKFTVSTEY